MALGYYRGKSIKALNDDIDHPNHQWEVIYVGDGVYAIKN